jgi:epoxyqueuosine reductase
MSPEAPEDEARKSVSVPTSAASGKIRELALASGYVACGVTRAERFWEYEEALDRRIELFPEAAPLYEELRGYADPLREAPWARSIVVCVRWYGRYDLPEGLVGHIGRQYLTDRRSSQGPDHGMPGRMSEGLERLGLRALAAKIPERLAAAKAGVARIGRNGFAYSDRYGSWIDFASWLVDAELPPGAPAADCPCPAGCRACIEACPTHAIVEPYVMRMDRCVAYLTYHAPEPIPGDLWEKMGSWIYGCDACQEACPLNRGKWRRQDRAPWLERAARHLVPEALAAMDEATYREIVHPLLWYIPVEHVHRWHANARRALGEKP